MWCCTVLFLFYKCQTLRFEIRKCHWTLSRLLSVFKTYPKLYKVPKVEEFMKIRKKFKKNLVEYMQNLQLIKAFMKATWNGYIPRNKPKLSLQSISCVIQLWFLTHLPFLEAQAAGTRGGATAVCMRFRLLHLGDKWVKECVVSLRLLGSVILFLSEAWGLKGCTGQCLPLSKLCTGVCSVSASKAMWWAVDGQTQCRDTSNTCSPAVSI